MDIEQLAGTKLGNYKVETLLGRGGMGVVYKARQISLNRPVALKILPPTLSSDSSFVKRFHREAEAIARLHHANIVQIYDIGEDQDLHFFSMEYMEGQALDEILRARGRLDINEAVRIIIQAAEGIEHAHKNGIIHRDIKPSNIILDDSGNAKVMDFGLARSTEERSKLTHSGTLLGTIDYMSPEQCRGEELDERTDIYSLGVVLYELLTGNPPFDAPHEAALIHKIINEKPLEVASVNPNVAPNLSDVVSRAMSNAKEDRYLSISEFLEDIRSLGALSRSTATPQKRASPSIAVLPFVNMSADPDQEYFCDGLSEELINALTQLRDLRVIARTSAFSFKGKDVKVGDIGRELKVETVLEGSVRKAGNRLRITAQLIDVSGGHHLWSERYDREMDDIFAIQDDITLAIVDKLRPRLLRKEKTKLARRQTIDLGAYNLYLQGRYFWNKSTEEGSNKAIQYFRQAIRKSPEYALAYAGLADSYSVLPFCSPTPPKEVFPKAREAALKALEIDDMLAEAHTSLAIIMMFYDWDWEGAEREHQLAIDLNPGYATGRHTYGTFLMHMTRFDEAIEEMDQALELDPLSLSTNADRGALFVITRQYDKAIGLLQKAIEIDPSFQYAHALLGAAYLQKGMYEEAMAELQKGRILSGGWDYLAETLVGGVYALIGKKDEAQQMLDNLVERSREAYVPPFYLAGLYFTLGETEMGFDLLAKAYGAHDPWLITIKTNPYFDILDLRSDPRYIALLKKMNLDK